MRWLVERSRDVFEDVGATDVAIEHGSLVFTTMTFEGAFLSHKRIEIIYAPGQWITVVPSGDDE